MKQKINPYHMIGLILFSAILYLIFNLTGTSPVSGLHWDIRPGEINLIPFRSIRDFLQSSSGSTAFRNIVGNILMFCPVGFFLPTLWEPFKNITRTILTGAGLSLFIECCQLFLIRGTDIDDVLLNTLGTVLGFLCYLALNKMIPSIIAPFVIRFGETGYASRFQKAAPYLLILFIFLLNIAMGGYQLYRYYQP